MDAQFNSPIGFLILEELKWIRKDLTEEMKSITKEIINLGYKLSCSQSDNLNTSDHPNDDHGGNTDMENYSGIKLEYFGSTDDNQQPKPFNDVDNTFNVDNNYTEAIEYQSENNLNNYDIPDTEQKNVNLAQPTLEIELPEIFDPDSEVNFNYLEKKNSRKKRPIKLKENKPNCNMLIKSNETLMNGSYRSKTYNNVEVKKSVCPYCHKSFASFHLKRHLRIHTGEKPFTCNDCGMRFAVKCNLKKHVGLHTGEEPVICSYCGKIYAHSGCLRYHIRMMHKQT